MEINIAQMKDLLHDYWGKQLPMMTMGAPGIGKSEGTAQVAKKIAKEVGKEYAEELVELHVAKDGIEVKTDYKKKDMDKHFFFIDVRISQLEPADIRGLPFPDGGNVRWLTPDWLPDGGQGILFFDEINLAPPSIQAAAYQLINDRKVGSYILPDGWTIFAAGNREIDGCNVFPMSAALKNRFLHATLNVPSDEEWIDWAMENEIHSDIISFIAFKPTLLFKFNKNSKDNAFPTPRTWVRASNAIKGHEKIDDVYLRAATCVGQATALEFQGYIKLKKKVNIDDILKNPKKVRDIGDLGLKYTMISGLAEKYKSDRNKMEPIMKVIEELDAEFGVFLLRLMRGMHQANFKKDLMTSKTWEKLYKQYSKFLL